MTTATHTATGVSRINFNRLTASVYMQSMCSYGRLHFTETGKMRLVHTIAFLEGIHCFDPERAYGLADSLCQYLDYLNEYAGMIDSPEGRTGGPDKTLLQFPAYRVVLGDDGGIGSFSIAWYRAIPHKNMMAIAEELADAHAMARHQKSYAALTSEQAGPVWEEALGEARAKLKLNAELEQYKCYFPDWDKDRKYYSREYVLYGYCHNGGLIYHHDRDDISKGHWSTHT